jgi:hypothetical protein
VDLNPPGSAYVIAYGMAGARQVGVVDGHAAIWSGTAGSIFDLHDLRRPEYYSASEARSIVVSGDDVWVAGTAYRGEIPHAVLWHYTVPEPSCIANALVGASCMAWRQRRKLTKERFHASDMSI